MADHSTRSSGEEREAGALPRRGLALVCALHALPLIWAALVLPWNTASWFTVAIGLLGVLHLVVFGLALTRFERALGLAWKVLSVYSLALLAAITWVVLTAALYLSELYGSIGHAVAGGLFGAWAACGLLTLPVACWGLARTVKLASLRRRRLGLGLAAVLVAAGAATLLVARTSRAADLKGVSLAEFERAVKKGLDGGPPPKLGEVTLYHTGPARCAEPVDAARLTLLVTALNREQAPVAHCLQARDAGALAQRLRHVVGRGPALLDLVTAVRPIVRLHPLLDVFSLRPAQDGVCADGRCLAPWQLVSLDAFGGHRPLPALASARLGVSLEWLAELLAAEPGGLTGIHTQPYVLSGRKLEREPAAPQAVRRATLKSALRLAERHILAAQQKSGAFRYILEPHSGHRDTASVNLPRQAGTTLVLCELGSSRKVQQVARRALDQLASYERRIGGSSVLTDLPHDAKLGSTALPLIALLTCRQRLGAPHDELIARAGHALLTFQRPDGGFYPLLDTRNGSAYGKHEALYASGQAVFALVLLEQLAASGEAPGLPERERLSAAVERAMDHYSSAYWPSGLRDLFFLEENWHCLAARAALDSHRHDAYERFCGDYVAFKARLILDELESPEPDYAGGYTFSAVVPPHTTTSAGFGEALAAAIAVKRARGEDTAGDEALLKRVLGFLLRRQWTPERCLLCAPGKEAVGGFSESRASPVIRIDYVQHAMAALGHGGRVLRLVP